ncbi:hypothetical protein [Nocardioides sp. SYSU D00065]|uniref:hypothetical protein n=1 Tax=Nocardioides sp. SYSU D00065 TaxID=2817378 RepID=UPI001B30AD02|nr:hypothetical protein [Nocardioides sp. SYSU D00065]
MYLRSLARRAATLAAATVTVLGVTSVVTAPAHAGQVGVTISITGAGSVRVVEGTVADGASDTCDASENVADPAATKTCSRIRSEAAFEAWLWLRPVPHRDASGSWRISGSGWQGCDATRVNAQVTECGVHSGAFSSDERFPSIKFYDSIAPWLLGFHAAASTTKDRTAVVDFVADEPTNAYCRFDGGQFNPCTTPFEHTFATDGEHKIEVQPVDLSGNAGQIHSRTVTLADAVIEQAPPAVSSSSTATFAFSTRGGTSFQCRVDDSPATRCGDGPRATHTVTGLRDGTHTLSVWANGDPVPAAHTWTVDTVAPDTTILNAFTPGRRATFDVTSLGSTSLECRLTKDGAAGSWTACAGPVVFLDLADGTYTVEIRGKDAAGNVDATPASHTWTVDTVPDEPGPPGPDTPGPDTPGPDAPGPWDPQTPTPGPALDTTAPDTVLTSAPAEAAFVLTDRTALGWSSSEPAGSWSCTLDGAPHTCSSATTELVGLTPGTHRFTVAAVDAAGNRDATPAARSWTVPSPSAALKHGKGWKQKRSTKAYGGSYAVSSRRGSVLSTRVRGARSIALVATTARRHGSVKVYVGKKLLRTVRLAARRTSTRQILPVATLPAPWTGKIRIVVAGAGQVRIEGLGVAS